MRRVMITGGAGFIGSCLVRYWLDTYPEDRVLCLDKLTYAGNLRNLAAVWESPRFEFVRADICDQAAVDQAFRDFEPDLVINLAAESHVDRSIADPEPSLRSNVLGVGVLLDACLAQGRLPFYQVSTDEVYGDLPLDRPDLAFREGDGLHPSSPYSAAKAGADLLCLSYWRTYQQPVVISRCSNNYGPCQHPEKLIPKAISLAAADQPIPIYGDGRNVRDWIHVSDHVRALARLVEAGDYGRVYNISAHHELDNLTLVRKILAIMDKPASLIEFVDDRKGHDRRYALDASRIEAELGWQAEVPFDRGLRETVDWYLAHPDWWADSANA